MFAYITVKVVYLATNNGNLLFLWRKVILLLGPFKRKNKPYYLYVQFHLTEYLILKKKIWGYPGT